MALLLLGRPMLACGSDAIVATMWQNRRSVRIIQRKWADIDFLGENTVHLSSPRSSVGILKFKGLQLTDEQLVKLVKVATAGIFISSVIP